MQKLCVVVLILVSMTWSCSKPPQDPVQESTSSKYHPGEEYSFDGRPGDDQPRCVVLKVDFQKKFGNIVHLSLSGIRMKNEKAPGGSSDKVQHLPISEDAFEKSNPKLLKSGTPLPDFKNGYEMWRGSFDEGKAGIWTAPLAACLQSMEKALNHP